MVNTPIPHSLKSEAKKAAKILNDFSVPSAKAGPDKLIPSGVLLKAKGLAILTVVRAGFLVTARAGSGIVIAKLNDDLVDAEWSAPSALGIAGLGGGFEIGAEVTDFVILLMSRSSVDAFSKGGNLTLGGNLSIAAGPLGRNIEADVALRSPAAIYTYSKTKGLFAGISIEGSALIERKDANKKFYGQEIRAYQILSGEVDPPTECLPLYQVLERHREKAKHEMVLAAKRKANKVTQSVGEKFQDRISSFSFKSKEEKSQHDKSPPQHNVHRSQTVVEKSSKKDGKKVTTKTVTKRFSASSKSEHCSSNIRIKMEGMTSTATALHSFQGQLPCDLSFKAGDVIQVLTQTTSDCDWWEGECHGNIGLFPSNYVKVK
ncbi:SH3 domain-containing YSC84-like protein 1 [Mytilus trossulus]|uniref:SH3 domain-containing YSC84-like protein 1 n=1 Tax=Mytilus trossulus TaxID=6551 RepID=UPI00300653B5